MTALAPSTDASHPDRFAAALQNFSPDRPVLVLSHDDADGLSAAAVLLRALPRAGFTVASRVLRRGEVPWQGGMAAELAAQAPGGLIVADLGVGEGAVLPGTPTVVIDHHVPRGTPGDALVLTGYGEEPVPTSSLLAYRCAQAVAPCPDLLWLAAVGIVGDLGDKAPFPELAAAKAAYTATAIRELVSLVNAPRRTASGDPGPALDLLLAADSPKDAIGGRHPQVERLQAAREEVKAAVEAGRRVPPRVVGEVALITVDSPCQIHPLIAQSWRGRLKDKLVIAANVGFRPGWIHFALRSSLERDLVAFLRDHAPPGADSRYGGGHVQATGGALRPDDWVHFLGSLGFTPNGRVAA